MSKRNEPIGSVECPVKGCSEQCSVFRFRERGESEKSVANRRFAGKLYSRCPEHGQFGGAANDAKMQDYILNNATMHGPKTRQESAGDRRPPPAAAPAKAPAKPQAAPTQAPASSPAMAGDTSAANIVHRWGFF